MLTPSETTALRHLAERASGSSSIFVKIMDARALTERGLARRSDQGWDITKAGLVLLASVDPPAMGGMDGPHAPLPLRLPTRPPAPARPSATADPSKHSETHNDQL